MIQSVCAAWNKDAQEYDPEDEVNIAHLLSLRANIMLQSVTTVVTSTVVVYLIVVMAIVTLPVRSEPMWLADMVPTSSMMTASNIPVAAIVVDVHASWHTTLKLRVSGLVTSELLHDNNLLLRLWAPYNDSLSWALHWHHSSLISNHLWLHADHHRLLLHRHSARLLLDQIGLRRWSVGNWVSIWANHLTICVDNWWQRLLLLSHHILLHHDGLTNKWS